MNIQYTYDDECNNMRALLDVLVIRNNNSIETTVYRKSTNNSTYLHWYSFSPKNWKRGTLRTVIKRAYVICSRTGLFKKELDPILFVFQK